MKIELTDIELALLVETVETSTYAGKFSRIVADLLEKLRLALPTESSGDGNPNV